MTDRILSGFHSWIKAHPPTDDAPDLTMHMGASRAAEYLSGCKTPHPDLARSMEGVIMKMVEVAK